MPPPLGAWGLLVFDPQGLRPVLIYAAPVGG